MRTAALLATLLIITACSTTPAPTKKAAPVEDDIDTPKDVDPNAPIPELGRASRDPTVDAPEKGPAPKAPRESRASAPSNAPGVIATLLYVTEVKDSTRPSGMRPCAMIFCSDETSPYAEERPRTSRIVKLMEPPTMLELLNELDGLGLSTLPFKEQPGQEAIPADRALYVFRDGKRRAVKKADLKNEELAQAFTRVEKKLITSARRLK